LRAVVFQDDDVRRQLEALIHPRVSATWKPEAARVKGTKEIRFFDIPLLYETKAEAHFDRVLVVACSPAVQRLRLQENRSLASDLIERIIRAQFDLLAKVVAADQVVWNDGSPAALDAQARLFAAYLHHYYG
jgi:dephospho-CoA kinase